MAPAFSCVHFRFFNNFKKFACHQRTIRVEFKTAEGDMVKGLIGQIDCYYFPAQFMVVVKGLVSII